MASTSFYRVKRHVLYQSGEQQNREVWGIDRPATGLRTTGGGARCLDNDDPLRSDGCDCVYLLQLADGRHVTWDRIWEWLSEASVARYTLVSGFEKMSPYSTLVLSGPT